MTMSDDIVRPGRPPVSAAAPNVAPSSGKRITARDVGLSFTKRRETTTALVGLSLDIEPGEFVSIVGPSGCGKSSFLRLVLGLEVPTSGRIDIDGQPVTGPRRDVGVVFQQPVLLNWRTVLSNVLLPIDIDRVPRRQAVARARHLLAQVGLAGFENHYPRELSGGMRHRVAIVRGLMHDPGVLLMDEPFAALDAMTRERMSADLQSLWAQERKTILFVTHSISEAVSLSTKVIVMSGRPGRIATTLTVPMPYPRTPEMMASASFTTLAATIRQQLGETHA